MSAAPMKNGASRRVASASCRARKAAKAVEALLRFAGPINLGDIATGRLKNVIDWVTSPVKGDPVWSDEFRASRGKVVGMLSASPGALGGLRAQGHLAPLLLNIQCWVAPRHHALSRAGDAFDAAGALVDPQARQSVEAVVDQVIAVATRLQGL